jgi:hypothetical protein
VIARRYNVDQEALSRQGTPAHPVRFGGANDADSNLAGTYLCYSNSWSPYYRGHMIRGTLLITNAVSAATPHVAYSEVLPRGQLQVTGH